jgi:hypothetical protein
MQPSWSPPLAVKCDVCAAVEEAKNNYEMSGWLILGIREMKSDDWSQERHACPRCAPAAFEKAAAAITEAKP